MADQDLNIEPAPMPEVATGLELGEDTGVATLEPTDVSAPPEPQVFRKPTEPDRGGFVWGTGRRKASVARVRVKPGTGVFLINKREVDNYFSEPQHRNQCLAALEATGTTGKVDIYVNAHGGGITGQAAAVLLGVSRALRNMDPTLEPALRERNFLTRDPRQIERKKYGQPGARRRFQFSKR